MTNAAVGSPSAGGANEPKSPVAIRRELWLSVCIGEDRNAVVKQLVQMTLDLACFRVVNEARRSGPKDADGNPRGS